MIYLALSILSFLFLTYFTFAVIGIIINLIPTPTRVLKKPAGGAKWNDCRWYEVLQFWKAE